MCPSIRLRLATPLSPISNQFCDLVFQTGLYQLIDKPTHTHGNILDLLLTNLDDNIGDLQIHPDQLLPSDHSLSLFSICQCCNILKVYHLPYFQLFQRRLSRSKWIFASIWFYTMLFKSWHWIYMAYHLTSSDGCYVGVHSHYQNPLTPTSCVVNSDIRHNIKHLIMLRCQYKRHPTQHTGVPLIWLTL